MTSPSSHTGWKKPSIASIQERVCARFGVSAAAMSSADRCWISARPRQASMHIARMLTGRSYRLIGRHHGGRHHTTVLLGARRIGALRAGDDDLDRKVRLVILDVLTPLAEAP